MSVSRSIASSLGSLKFGALLYYVAFACCALAGDLQLTSLVRSGFAWVQSFALLLQIAACFLLAFKLFAFQRYTTSQLVLVAGLSLVALLSYYVAKDSLVMLAILFVIAGKGVSLKSLAKIELVVTICMLAVAFIGDSTGVLESVVMDRDGVRGIRRSMGFEHPNALGIALVKICAAAFIIGGSGGLLAGLALSAVSTAVIVVVCDSRTALLGLGVLVAFIVVRESVYDRPLGSRIFLAIIVGLAGLSMLASLYFMAFYSASNPFHAYLNELLTGRLNLASWYYGLYPPTLFGQDVSQLPVFYSNGGHTTSQLVLDNAYARLYVRYGPIALALSLASLCWFLVRSNKLRAYGVVFVGADAVVFTGARTDVPSLLSAFDVFAFPSLFEGLGVSLVEAQANGLCCVASDRVPRVAAASGSVTFLPLDDAGAWAGTLLGRSRADFIPDEASLSRFDIKRQAQVLKGFLLGEAQSEGVR